MRIALFILLFALVLGAPFILRRALVPAEPPSGTNLRLVVVTPHSIDICREFARAFDRWHRAHYGTGVTIDFRRPGGTNDIARLLQTTYQARAKSDHYVAPEMDVVWGGGDYFFNNQIQPQAPDKTSSAQYQILQPLGLEDDPQLKHEFDACFPQPTLAGVNLYERKTDARKKPLPCQWVGVCLSSFGIVYNPDVYRRLDLPPPRTWDDLVSPRLAGWVALADPTHSGSAAVAYEMVLQRAMADAEADYFANHPSTTRPAKAAADSDYQAALARGWHSGMGQLVAIAANARYFTDGSPEVPNDVGNGEAAVGIAIDFYGWTDEQTLGTDRCRFVLPPAATAITPDPVGILADVRGPELELSRHFVEFLLSPEGQKLWDLKPGAPGGPEQHSLRRMPIRRDVYADRTGWADDIDPYTAAGTFNERPQWMALFGETLPIWGAAWIDARDDLIDAWTKIARVPDASQRMQLRARLCDLPITMADVQRQHDLGRTIVSDAKLWQARKRMDWARRFRDHYRQVAAEADRLSSTDSLGMSASQ